MEVVSRKREPSGRRREVGEGARSRPSLVQVTSPPEEERQTREAGEPVATSRSLGPSTIEQEARLRPEVTSRTSTMSLPAITGTVLSSRLTAGH